MAIPGQSLSIRDPGLGIVDASPNAPLYVGCSSAGTVNTMYTFSNKADVVDTLGQGPLSEALCYALDVAGGPIRGMRLTGGTAGAAGAVTKTAVGSSTGTITVAGAAYDAYEVIVEIMLTGTLGAGHFRYSLDDGYTYSDELTIPSGATYAIPNTNLTLTFVPGGGATFFEKADKHEFDCTAPIYTTTNLASGVTAILASPLEFSFLYLTGKSSSAANGATMFAALATHMTSLANQFRFARAIMDVGNDTTTNVGTSFATQESARICPVYGDADMASSKPFAGWGTPMRSATVLVAARAAASLISTDLGRVSSGSLPGVVAISFDEFRSETLDAQKISTLRTWQGRAGFYITNARLKSAAGSDFLYWQHGRVMDVACDVTQKSQQQFINASVRTNSNGTINEKDALRFEQIVNDALRTTLLDPSNAEGTPGLVSALQYKIDRNNNVQTSFTVKSKVAIRPLGYAKTLVTELGYTLNVGG